MYPNLPSKFSMLFQANSLTISKEQQRYAGTTYLNDQTSALIVKTESGDVRGDTVDNVHVFKGVPFAAPPFGPNYLRPPQPPEHWKDVRNTLEFGPKPPQVPYPPGIAEGLAELVGTGEDCLTLNVWTPNLGTAGLPVMVWIPGGMFEFHATGAVAYYNGSRFARDGVVCVSINYRVGAQGFLHLDDGIPNLGLLDQIAALEWVKKNIIAFGGDPSKVTIFGESAGAMSVATLLAIPKAKGLFHRAIVQSGSNPKLNSMAIAKRVGQRLAEILGIEATLEAIKATPSDQILHALTQLSGARSRSALSRGHPLSTGILSRYIQWMLSVLALQLTLTWLLVPTQKKHVSSWSQTAPQDRRSRVAEV